MSRAFDRSSTQAISDTSFLLVEHDSIRLYGSKHLGWPNLTFGLQKGKHDMSPVIFSFSALTAFHFDCSHLCQRSRFVINLKYYSSHRMECIFAVN